MTLDNLFRQPPDERAEELVDVLVKNQHVRIERIVSTGQASPDGFSYDQAEDEWVVLLTGAAKLKFDDQQQPVHLTPGDYLSIPAGRKHRIEWTEPDQTTVWLAVFY